MPLQIECSCGKRLRVREERAGKRVRCPGCGRALTVPEAEPSAEEVQQFLRVLVTRSEMNAADRLLSLGTAASNPGDLRVNYVRYFLAFPDRPLVLAAVLLGALALAWWVHWGFWILAGLAALVNLFFWYGVRMHFRYGCVNPARVVATDPYLVAVVTDLNTGGGGNWDVVKILRQPLGRMTGGPPALGDRLATVALYRGNVDASHWDDFFPKVVNCVTTDEAEIERVFRSLGPQEWKELDEGLRQVPRPYEPGLYRVDLTDIKPAAVIRRDVGEPGSSEEEEDPDVNPPISRKSPLPRLREGDDAESPRRRRRKSKTSSTVRPLLLGFLGGFLALGTCCLGVVGLFVTGVLRFNAPVPPAVQPAPVPPPAPGAAGALPQGGAQAPEPGQAEVVLEVVALPPQGDALQLARAALASVAWADLNTLRVNAREVRFGVRGRPVRTGEAKAALEAKGFRIGRTTYVGAKK